MGMGEILCVVICAQMIHCTDSNGVRKTRIGKRRDLAIELERTLQLVIHAG